MKKIAWKWSTTGYQLANLDHETIQQLCRASGLSGIEGVPPLFEGLSEATVAKIKEQYRAQDLQIDSFHLPFAPEDDIASFYESVRRKAVDRILHWMNVAAAAGCRVCIQHPSTSRASIELEGVDPFIRALGRSLEILLPRAAELGLILALENMLPGEGGRFGSRPEHFTRFLREFDHRGLGFCLDTGHALVAGRERAHEYFEAMRPRLAAFHLADNAGDRDSHLAPGKGRVDWAPVFRGMAAIGFSNVACIETPPFAFGPPYSAESWGKMVEETSALAERSLS